MNLFLCVLTRGQHEQNYCGFCICCTLSDLASILKGNEMLTVYLLCVIAFVGICSFLMSGGRE